MTALSRHVSARCERVPPREATCRVANAVTVATKRSRNVATASRGGTRLTAARPRVQFWASRPENLFKLFFQLQEQDVDISAGNKFRSIDTCQQQFRALLPRFLLKFYRRNVIKIQGKFWILRGRQTLPCEPSSLREKE